MNILLTGGAGYIGSACARMLIKNGHHAVVYDDLSDGHVRAVPDCSIYRGDISEPSCINALTHILKQHDIDAIWHLAAKASVPESISQPDVYYKVNILGTKNILDAMIGAGVPRILFSSTAAVYAHIGAGFKIDENSLLVPMTPYGRSKLAAEWMINDYAVAYGITYGIFRFFNVAGADKCGNFGEHRKKESHIIPLALKAILNHQPIYVYGTDHDTVDGTCVRDYVYVNDIASAHLLITERCDNAVYNLGSGHGYSVKQILKICEQITGESAIIEYVDQRQGDPAYLVTSIDKISKLGWRKLNGIEEIIESTWKWCNAHPRGYAP